jgi:hypothetical protein
MVVSKVATPPDQRLISQVPAAPSSVLPTAMAAALASEPSVVALAASAPRKIAGASRSPRSSRMPNAKPVGGQIGLALGWIEASASPALASAK